MISPLNDGTSDPPLFPPSLRTLRLHGGSLWRLGARALSPLGGFPHLRSLRLALVDKGLGPQDAEALGMLRTMPRLETRGEVAFFNTVCWKELGRVYLQHTQYCQRPKPSLPFFFACVLSPIVSCPKSYKYPSVFIISPLVFWSPLHPMLHLSLAYNAIKPAGALALATLRHAPRLQVLDLGRGTAHSSSVYHLVEKNIFVLKNKTKIRGMVAILCHPPCRSVTLPHRGPRGLGPRGPRGGPGPPHPDPRAIEQRPRCACWSLHQTSTLVPEMDEPGTSLLLFCAQAPFFSQLHQFFESSFSGFSTSHSTKLICSHRHLFFY